MVSENKNIFKKIKRANTRTDFGQRLPTTERREHSEVSEKCRWGFGEGDVLTPLVGSGQRLSTCAFFTPVLT